MRTHRAIQTLNHQEESLAQTPVWFSKWHLRCVWREADGCLRLLRRRREREWRGVVEGVEWRKETGRDRGEWRVVSQEEVGGTFFLPSLHGQMQLCDCFNTCVFAWTHMHVCMCAYVGRDGKSMTIYNLTITGTISFYTASILIHQYYIRTQTLCVRE